MATSLLYFLKWLIYDCYYSEWDCNTISVEQTSVCFHPQRINSWVSNKYILQNSLLVMDDNSEAISPASLTCVEFFQQCPMTVYQKDVFRSQSAQKVPLSLSTCKPLHAYHGSLLKELSRPDLPLQFCVGCAGCDCNTHWCLYGTTYMNIFYSFWIKIVLVSLMISFIQTRDSLRMDILLWWSPSFWQHQQSGFCSLGGNVSTTGWIAKET